MQSIQSRYFKSGLQLVFKLKLVSGDQPCPCLKVYQSCQPGKSYFLGIGSFCPGRCCTLKPCHLPLLAGKSQSRLPLIRRSESVGRLVSFARRRPKGTWLKPPGSPATAIFPSLSLAAEATCWSAMQDLTELLSGSQPSRKSRSAVKGTASSSKRGQEKTGTASSFTPSSEAMPVSSASQEFQAMSEELQSRTSVPMGRRSPRPSFGFAPTILILARSSI